MEPPEFTEPIAKYLLGDTLLEEERIQIEEAYFHSDEALLKIELVEDELVDAYVLDRLSLRQRRLFKIRLAGSARWCRKVECARQIVAHVAATEEKKRTRLFWTIPVLCAVAAAIIISILISRPNATVPEIAEVTAPLPPNGTSDPTPQKPKPNQTSTQTARPSDAPPAEKTKSSPPTAGTPDKGEPILLAFALQPRVRGTDQKLEDTLRIPKGSYSVQLRTSLRARDGTNYRAIIRHQETHEEIPSDRITTTTADGFISFIVPSSSLRDGTYLVTVDTGEGTIGGYAFDVVIESGTQ